MNRSSFPSVWAKILSVIMGTLLGGFMWRCRGESGFGSSWGLYSVALMLLMLIWVLYGNRKGFKYELIPFGAFLMGVGVTGYATIIDQLGGYLNTDPGYGGVDYIELNDYRSGAVIFFLMACTFVPFFSFFIGSLFSKKEYKIRDYVAVVFIFFIVSYIMKLWPAHAIFKAINPEQYNFALLGLREAGITDSPFAAYMKHFAQRSWCDDIPFFENYYMSVEHISDVAGVISVICYAVVKMKDKLTAVITFVMSVFTGIFSTLGVLLYVANFSRGVLGSFEIPESIHSLFDWGIWEYVTGASVGFITMLCAAIASGINKAEKSENTEPIFKDKRISFAFNLIFTVFIFGINPARVLGIRFFRLLYHMEILPDDEPYATILTIILSVVLGVIILLKLKKSILDNGKNAFGITPLRFVYTAFPVFFIYCALNYFITNHGIIFNLPYSEYTSVGTFFRLMISDTAETFIMLVSLIVILVLGSVFMKKSKKESAE